MKALTAQGQDTTLLVLGYSLQLLGFVIAVVELLVVRLNVISSVRRFGAAWRRVAGAASVVERRLTAVHDVRALLEHEVSHASEERDVAGRVARLETQIHDVTELLQREAADLEESLRDQRLALNQLETDLGTSEAEQERGARSDGVRQAAWSLPPLLFFITGTILNIFGTLN
jgi:hypothetical protein